MLCGAGGKAPGGGGGEANLGKRGQGQTARQQEEKEVLTQVLEGGRRGQDQGEVKFEEGLAWD